MFTRFIVVFHFLDRLLLFVYYTSGKNDVLKPLMIPTFRVGLLGKQGSHLVNCAICRDRENVDCVALRG